MSVTSPIQDQINLLKEQLADHEQQIPRNGDKINAITNRISELEYELAQTQQQKAEREQQIEQKIEGDEITFSVPGVDFTQLPVDLIKLIDKVVRADRRRIYGEENEKYDQLIAGHKEELRGGEERELQLKRQNESLQGIIDAGKPENQRLTRENGDLRDLISTRNHEIVDLEQKLANATTQLDEANRENDRLQGEISDYQKAKVYGERDAQKVIDVTPEETNELQDLVNQIVAINHVGGNWHEVVKEDGTKTVLHQNDLPSLKAETGHPFRGEDGANPATENGGVQGDASEAAETVGGNFPVTPPGIPSIAHPMAKDTSELGGSGAEAQVTRSEFDELKRAVDTLYVMQRAVEDHLGVA